MLEKISMVCANFGNGLVFPTVLDDWFRFLGGKTGEVVVVDGGSDWTTQAMYCNLMREGKLDKLQLISPSHPDNDKEKCFIQEHAAGSLGTLPYLLFWKADTLPYRKGHELWIEEAVRSLDCRDTFAVGGSFNFDSRHHRASPGWYFSHKCSENFCLMKRDRFHQAMEEFAGPFIRSGFKSENPADASGQGRFLIEVAFEAYIRKHQYYTLVREEDESWVVAHTNLRDAKLLKARERFFDGSRTAAYLAELSDAKSPNGVYFGTPGLSWHRRLRVAFGETRAGAAWRTARKLVKPD